MTDRRTIAIAGGGIGGLMAAIALARGGLRVSVYERSQRFAPFGAGIQLSPNASRVLFAFGLGKALATVASEPEQLVIRRGRDAQELGRAPLKGFMKQRYGAPYLILHRADLHTVLKVAAEKEIDIDVEMGTAVADFARHKNGVTVLTERDHQLEEHRVTALIGADGIRSTVRARMFGNDQPVPAERTAWRALVPADQLPKDFAVNSVGLWLGPDAHLVHYPVRGGSVVNVVAVVANAWQASWTGEGWNAPGDKDELAGRFSAWAPQVRDLIDALPSVTRWALADRKPLRRWGEGEVTLLGDAAHPMLPFLAQGGGMAIEDAMVLGRCLVRGQDVAASLRKYERLRRYRTARVQKEARKLNKIYHYSNPMAHLRDMAMNMRSGEKIIERYNWLYRHKS
ncbi:MAG: FAD-dependent monooxygenase [Tepidamorphaceae bacterium]|nr:FAD-dependent monooxygenase [Rhodobiaceae bacterium]MCC0048892.1 FAD-dependent monooxygenase [Rhodobiaceae bacterium]